MNIFYVACMITVAAAVLWSATFGVSALLRSLDETPLKQPDGSPEGGDVEGDTPPTAASAPPVVAAVRCRRTVMFGVLFAPNITVRPLQEAS